MTSANPLATPATTASRTAPMAAAQPAPNQQQPQPQPPPQQQQQQPPSQPHQQPQQQQQQQQPPQQPPQQPHRQHSSTETAPNGVCPGHAHDNTRPAPAPPGNPPQFARKSKGKKHPGMDSNEGLKLVAARISQLELDAAGEKDQEAEIEREVKKANRELHTQTSKMNDMQKIDHLHKRCSDLLAEMKRHERESIKNKKRGDQLQKEKDASRNELSKQTTLKDKLEKLCREIQRENNKLKNENKTLSDNQIRNQNSWDEKYSTLLQKLDDYQEEKDNPRKEVVDMELDELFVPPLYSLADWSVELVSLTLTIFRFKQKFKSLIDQYELREIHFNSLMRTKELEVQYHLARYEKEKKAAESESGRSRQLNAQVQTFSKTETELRQQLNVYVDKFKQVMLHLFTDATILGVLTPNAG
ncbi:myosin-like coiled-coil protein-domain-containing protein [Coniochaeta sp. 2T2.1]|nr:myosin-like coiled-coil protein-domain-containing protein [Coniochaeta sp. 2T2.1]